MIYAQENENYVFAVTMRTESVLKRTVKIYELAKGCVIVVGKLTVSEAQEKVIYFVADVCVFYHAFQDPLISLKAAHCINMLKLGGGEERTE